MTRILALTTAALALSIGGCTRVTPIRMPDGNMGYSISCPPAEGGTACIQKAGELCPAGYRIASQGGTTMSSFYANNGFFYGSTVTRPQIMVECNGASMLTPSAASVTDDPSRLVNCRMDGKTTMMLRGACEQRGGEVM